MGNVSRIKRQLNRTVSMVDTGVIFNECRVYLGSSNIGLAKKMGVEFGKFMNYLNNRARSVNFRDLYAAHFRLLAEIESGKPFLKFDNN